MQVRAESKRYGIFIVLRFGGVGPGTLVGFAAFHLFHIHVVTGGNNGGGYVASKYVVICLHGGLDLVFTCPDKQSSHRLVSLFRTTCYFMECCVLVLMVPIPTVATEKATADFVFTRFNMDNALVNFLELILGLVYAVAKYLSVPLLALTSLSELSYCAHESKMRLVLIPLLIGIVVTGIFKDATLELYPQLKEFDSIEDCTMECPNDIKKYTAKVNSQRVYVFLAGLDSHLDGVRGRVLAIKPLLDIQSVYAM
ncbi:hypothetical protein IFM89_023086, partial [Coptis chinensis]